MNDGGPAWRAYIAEPVRAEGERRIVLYCPECAVREFGPIRASERADD